MKTMDRMIDDKTFDWEPYITFIDQATLGYRIINVKIIEDTPLLTLERDSGCKIAMVLVPTLGTKILDANLIKAKDYSRNYFCRLLSLTKHTMKMSNLNMPLIIAQCRLEYSRGSGKKELVLSKWWLF